MTDNELIRLFLPIIQANLISASYVDVVVKQFNQPTQQGINTTPTVYFSKISDHRYGYLGRFNQYNQLTDRIDHEEIQMYETTFQIMALVLQNPANPSYTAADLVNEVAAILQSDSTIDTLATANVGILRITDIRNPYFKDDRDQFEASPSFDFTLTHRQTRISTTPVARPIEVAVYPI
jgi:hypothetical protein